MTNELKINGTILDQKDPIVLSKKAQSLVLDLVKSTHSVYRREINHWQRARASRRSENPRTYLIQQVYEDTMIDTHLSSVIDNRILRIQNKRFIVRKSDGTENPEKTKLITKKWFSDLLRYVMESVFYEYSLIQLVHEDGEIKSVYNVPRGHVIPECGIILKNLSDTTGLDYTQYPNDLLFVKLYNGYGLLEKAAPLCILKRHSWASWDEFEQMFGMPIRIAKMGSMTPEVKQEVAGWLENMGSAAYGIFPNFAEIEIKEANNRDAFNVFFKKIETVDKQNSILINGQTMTVQDGSSHSQATVHQNTQDDITEADLKNCLYWLNDHFLPAMRAIGYNIDEDETIGVERVTNPLDKMKTDEKIMNAGYVFKKDYLERIYGVEIESSPTAGTTNPKPVENEKKH